MKTKATAGRPGARVAGYSTDCGQHPVIVIEQQGRQLVVGGEGRLGVLCRRVHGRSGARVSRGVFGVW